MWFVIIIFISDFLWHYSANQHKELRVVGFAVMVYFKNDYENRAIPNLFQHYFVLRGLHETKVSALDSAKASLALAVVFDNCTCFACTFSGLQTRWRSLKPNPKPKPWIRKGPGFIAADCLYILDTWGRTINWRRNMQRLCQVNTWIDSVSSSGYLKINDYAFISQ